MRIEVTISAESAPGKLLDARVAIPIECMTYITEGNYEEGQ